MGDKKNAQPEKNKNDIDIIETKNSNNNQFFFKRIDISKMIDNRYKRIYEIYGNAKMHYRLRMPCEPYDVKYKQRKAAESDQPTKEDFEKWFNDELQKRGSAFSAYLAEKMGIKAFDKKEDK